MIRDFNHELAAKRAVELAETRRVRGRNFLICVAVICWLVLGYFALLEFRPKPDGLGLFCTKNKRPNSVEPIKDKMFKVDVINKNIKMASAGLPRPFLEEFSLLIPLKPPGGDALAQERVRSTLLSHCFAELALGVSLTRTWCSP